MKRREFLAMTGMGAALVAIPGVGFITTTVEEATASIILREYHYLKLDRKGVEMFVEDYLKKYRNTTLEIKLKTFHLLALGSDQANFAKNLAHSYLYSTDFFINKMDESKPVFYIGSYDPYLSPCANPFANHQYPSDMLTPVATI